MIENHFVAIANAIRLSSERERRPGITLYHETINAETKMMEIMRIRVAHKIATALEVNKKFDYSRFMKACGF